MLFARCSQFRANVLRPLKLGMYASLHCLIYVKVCYSDKVKRGVFYRSNLFVKTLDTNLSEIRGSFVKVPNLHVCVTSRF